MFNPLDFLQVDDSKSYDTFEGPQLTDFNTLAVANNLAATNNSSIFNHPDPLSQAHHFDMPKANLHIVKPHFVDSYIKEDGTFVEGYYRDGSLNGGNYLRSNPDERLDNNLNQK